MGNKIYESKKRPSYNSGGQGKTDRFEGRKKKRAKTTQNKKNRASSAQRSQTKRLTIGQPVDNGGERKLSFTEKTVIGIVIGAAAAFAVGVLASDIVAGVQEKQALNDYIVLIEEQEAANQEMEDANSQVEKALNGETDDAEFDSLIESYARDHLNMVMPGEIIYKNTVGG